MDCLEKNHVTMGEKVRQLEDGWSSLLGHKHTICTSSGTTAVMSMCMALHELGAQPGDEIIVPALSFIATANAVRAANFVPIFVDVDRRTLNINQDVIEGAITPKTKAILAVNLMGKPAKLKRIREICDKNNLYFLNDCCESHFCQVDHKYAECYADMTAYSLYAAHILFSTEMGFVCTNNEKMDYLIRSIRSHGRNPNSLYFSHEMFSLNLKPTDLHASVGLGNLEEGLDIFQKRYNNVDKLKRGLDHIREFCWFSEEDEDEINSPHAFSMTLKEENKVQGLIKVLEENGIEWKRNFGCMATQHRCFAYLNHKLGDFPEAEWVGDNGIHVGVHQYLSNEDVDFMIDVISGYFKKEEVDV